MPEDLAVINNESYNLGLQKIAEARMQQNFLDATKKLEEAKIHLIAGVEAKIKELQSKLVVCNEQIFYYSNQIDKLNEEIELEKIGAEVQILSDSISKIRINLDFWKSKKSEIERLLEKICAKYGHQIDTSEKPVRIEKYELPSIAGLAILKYYVCKCCGKEIWLDDNFNLKDWEWYDMMNTKFTKRIVEEEVSFDNSKLVLGKTKVILPDVDK